MASNMGTAVLLTFVTTYVGFLSIALNDIELLYQFGLLPEDEAVQIADFALAGACKAHFVTEPTPVSWLGDHKEMLFNYTDRVFNADTDASQWMGNDELPESLNSI